MHIKVHNVCSAAIEIIMELQKKKKKNCVTHKRKLDALVTAR